ncbi:MAG: hypothetical protein WBA01_08235 [Phormidesmis sp.]
MILEWPHPQIDHDWATGRHQWREITPLAYCQLRKDYRCCTKQRMLLCRVSRSIFWPMVKGYTFAASRPTDTALPVYYLLVTGSVAISYLCHSLVSFPAEWAGSVDTFSSAQAPC